MRRGGVKGVGFSLGLGGFGAEVRGGSDFQYYAPLTEVIKSKWSFSARQIIYYLILLLLI